MPLFKYGCRCPRNPHMQIRLIRCAHTHTYVHTHICHMSSEAMNVEVDQWDACDIKDSSFTFVKQNHSKCQHFFRSLGEMVQPTEPCRLCQDKPFYNGSVAFSEGSLRQFQLDVVECDTPCQPFSHLRSGCSAEEHPGYKVTFGTASSPD